MAHSNPLQHEIDALQKLKTVRPSKQHSDRAESTTPKPSSSVGGCCNASATASSSAETTRGCMTERTTLTGPQTRAMLDSYERADREREKAVASTLGEPHERRQQP